MRALIFIAYAIALVSSLLVAAPSFLMSGSAPQQAAAAAPAVIAYVVARSLEKLVQVVRG